VEIESDGIPAFATFTKSWKNSDVREIIPKTLREKMDALCREDFRQTVRNLSRLTYGLNTPPKQGPDPAPYDQLLKAGG
jgi:hypothetical protein